MRADNHLTRMARMVRSARERYAGSWAEALWKRLEAVDFMSQGLQFAATLLLCFFPFMIVTNALAGRSTVTALVRRLGLDRQASADVSDLFAPSTTTSSAVTGTASVFFVLGGFAAASALQQLYQRIFELPGRGVRDVLHQVLSLAVVIAGAALAAWTGPALHRVGGPVLLGAVGLVAAALLWWVLMRLLLAGRVPWRDLLPSAVITAVCYLGMRVVFSFTASDTVTSNTAEYGPIGVVFFLMSWLIALGVVIILGAVTGIVWRERGLSLRAALGRRPRPGKPGRG